MNIRKQLTFDIDTKIAQKIFGSGYRKIYLSIERLLVQDGYRHIEGSVYQSMSELNNTDVSMTLYNLMMRIPGIEKCIRDMRLTDITEENSLNYLFQYDGTAGKYSDKSENKPKQRNDYTR